MAEMNQNNVKKEIFPVGLLAAGRRCVVVGGGRIGARKAGLLLDAGAEVTVISPQETPELRELRDQGVVKHVGREFEPDDVEGAFLVFAATSARSVNEKVLDTCRERGIYACSIDKNWPKGDFVTPATVRKDGITVSVSTGGKSCRRAKMIKDSFNRHLQMVESADLLVVGTSHDYLPIHEREPFHLAGRCLEEVGEMLMQVWGVHEFSILNTCNRVELHAVASESPGVEQVLQHILGFNALDSNGFYIKRGYDAFAHLNFLTAGLLSQTPGEKHIVSQVKEAVNDALKRGWAGAMIQQWHDAAMHVSKHIRNETRDILHHREIEDLCLLYLDHECPAWGEQRVMVIGAGIVGAGVVARLTERGQVLDWCYHRRKPEAPAENADQVRFCTLNDLRDNLSHVDVIICAAGGGSPVIHTGHAPFFNQKSDTLIVDLAMPRNVAPEVNDLGEALRVVDLDDLKHWYRREMADMVRIFEISTHSVAEHRDMYDKLINTFQGGNAQQ